LREASHSVEDPPSRQGAPLSSLRSIAETQLAIQFSRAGSYDGQSLGILGLDAALAAAAIAGDQLLGRLWWLALIGLLLSAASCAAVLFTRVDQVGPRVDDLIDGDEGLTRDQMERLLIESLDDSIRRNARALDEKSGMLLVATIMSSATIFGAIIGVLAS
jgi:hypothetical protein